MSAVYIVFICMHMCSFTHDYKSYKHTYKIIPIDTHTHIHIYCKKYLRVCIFDICKSYIHAYK